MATSAPIVALNPPKTWLRQMPILPTVTIDLRDQWKSKDPPISSAIGTPGGFSGTFLPIGHRTVRGGKVDTLPQSQQIGRVRGHQSGAGHLVGGRLPRNSTGFVFSAAGERPPPSPTPDPPRSTV